MRTPLRYGFGGAAVLGVGALLATDRTVPGEVGLAEALNGLPAPVIDALEVFMLLGTLGGVVLVAVVAAVLAGARRSRVVAAVVLAGGLGWVASGLVHEILDSRPRPPSSDLVARRGGGGFRYPSTEVSIATAALSAATLATRRSPASAIAVGAVVGAGGMAVGTHLPLDVVGGLGLGVAAAVVVVETVERS